MKKIYLVLLTLVMLSFNVFSQKQSSQLSTLESLGNTSKDAITTVYSDVKSGISTVYGDVSELSGPIYNEVKSAVKSIATGIGCAAEHVYTIIVKKYVVEGISELCYLVLGLIILIFGMVKTNTYFKNQERIDWKCLYPFALIIVGGLITMSVKFSDMLVNLVIPEWKALEYIIDTAKSMVK